MSSADAFFQTIITVLFSILVANTFDYFGILPFGIVLILMAVSWVPVGFVSAEIIDRVPPFVSDDQAYLPDSIKREWIFYGWIAFCLAVPILLWAFFKLAHRKISFSR
ncbi:MAG: hypothetical protein A3A97_00855 [Candidatus Terrybacteria bacterium RIFCSPLOWO2_01_FULL_40_23]|uniref:Uncharacterized protein n=1 Tax=Candidatus Terrybacteria bacterium RIFCSPLOWO2_01_FULL_40_23 TaxID=1802366 RepID=A0A1G2PUS3_9BACT|nr:MAG: hypothetical protein A3A97_00855 [Candidatus Terrybacteria bacterium RIFCSPLOWO2_01_FULL_40_23]